MKHNRRKASKKCAIGAGYCRRQLGLIAVRALWKKCVTLASELSLCRIGGWHVYAHLCPSSTGEEWSPVPLIPVCFLVEPLWRWQWGKVLSREVKRHDRCLDGQCMPRVEHEDISDSICYHNMFLEASSVELMIKKIVTAVVF